MVSYYLLPINIITSNFLTNVQHHVCRYTELNKVCIVYAYHMSHVTAYQIFQFDKESLFDIHSLYNVSIHPENMYLQAAEKPNV